MPCPLKKTQKTLKVPRYAFLNKKIHAMPAATTPHASMLMGSMRLLCGMKDDLNGIVYFCFEAGEEVGASSRQMIKALAKRSVDTVWAIHVYSPLASGKIGIRSGACMAGFGGIDITVHGKGGHGSRPDLSINPVFAAADIVFYPARSICKPAGC